MLVANFICVRPSKKNDLHTHFLVSPFDANRLQMRE